MTYKEFISELQKKLEGEKQEIGYDQMVFLEDGMRSTDVKELSLIRETNIKYHRTESDVLIGDYIILYQYKGNRKQICRYDCGQLYREYENGGWAALWEQILSSIARSRKFMDLGIMDLIEKNEYDSLKDRLFIRPLNFNDHRYELKDRIYRRVGDMVLVLYLLVSDEDDGESHDMMSAKVHRVSMKEWGINEEEVWENAMCNTYLMAPPRMYLKPSDSHCPPYHRGAFMALNSNITSLSPLAVPTVTTTAQLNGAIAMFYPGVMKRIAELFGDDYYIAFTGTCEARLHKKGTIQPRNILDLIKYMNKTFDPSEVLSRKVYLYERAKQEMRQLEL